MRLLVVADLTPVYPIPAVPGRGAGSPDGKASLGGPVRCDAAAVPHLATLDAPAGGQPGWAVAGWTAVACAVQVDALGYDDLTESAPARLARFADTTHVERHVLLALADGVPVSGTVPATGPDGGDPAAVLGYAHLDLPRTDNTHLALLELAVHPRVRGRGTGAALWAAAHRLAADAGRRTLTTWTQHPVARAAGERLVATTGAGWVPAGSAPARFATARGFTLEQVERHSVLEVDPGGYGALEQAAAAHAGGAYRLVQWTGPTPEPHLPDIAELLRRMSVDVPLGGLEFEEEVWDAARVRAEETRTAEHGDIVTTAAAAPGRGVVAYTQIVVPADKPAVGWQENTIVHAEHRGHRLGMLVKAANLRLLRERHPTVRRVHTWNADENAHMLAINDRLGFRLVSMEGAWQRPLP